MGASCLGGPGACVWLSLEGTSFDLLSSTSSQTPNQADHLKMLMVSFDFLKKLLLLILQVELLLMLKPPLILHLNLLRLLALLLSILPTQMLYLMMAMVNVYQIWRKRRPLRMLWRLRYGFF